MNFDGFNFDEETKSTLKSLENNGRIPHAVIIECLNDDKALECARFLTAFLMCQGEDKPCGKCRQCQEAELMIHPDVTIPNPENKSKTLSINQMQDLMIDTYISPNQGEFKAYIFKNADQALKVDVQNALLKTLEEPPQNVHFILLCKNAGSLLVTVRSRCVTIKLREERLINEKSLENAESIINGIISPKEYDLLRALTVLENKSDADDVIDSVVMTLRDGMAILVGAKPEHTPSLVQKVSARLTKKQIIEMIELSRKAQQRIKQNVNTQLLITWLCSEYRRILWQR